MELRQVALVSETPRLSFSELSKVSAALQKQAIRDLGPVWGIHATVDAFAKLEDVPLGSWPIVVQDNIHTPGAAGVHEDQNGQPFALVQFDDGWSLTASHECIEMLVDPFGRRMQQGQSPKKGQGRVEFLVEPCDPSEAVEFAYTINGVTVSDFYTPRYFTLTANPGERYSFTGAIKAPRQILKGGYLSWHDPKTDHWFQATFFEGTKPKFKDLGRFTAQHGKNPRRLIYDVTSAAFSSRKPQGKHLSAMRSSATVAGSSTEARATNLRKTISAIIKSNSK